MNAFVFVDKISNEPPIRVRALLSFLSTEEGGRQTPAFSGIAPITTLARPADASFTSGKLRSPKMNRSCLVNPRKWTSSL